MVEYKVEGSRVKYRHGIEFSIESSRAMVKLCRANKIEVEMHGRLK